MRRLALIFGMLVITAAVAQQASEIWGLIYVSSAPTLSDKQLAVWRGSSAGQLVTDINVAPGACNGTIDFSTGCMQPIIGGL